ncbi:MerR family transcriptional regulator [Desulfotomaculum defluvii]
MTNQMVPKLNIGVISELLGVHPETLRIWERNGLIQPERRNKQRLYSSNDVIRLRFIHQLINKKGLNIASVKQVIQLYPCWFIDNCIGNINDQETQVNPNKPCWKIQGTFCLSQNTCDHCPLL